MVQEKTIGICGKLYGMKASMLTALTYETLYGESLLEALTNLSKSASEQKLDVVKALRIAHIMIKENDQTFTDFEEWIEGLNGLLDNPKWFGEVVMLGMSIFRNGKVQE